MAEMMLNIGANVNDAVQGLGFVADRTKQLQTQIEYLRGKLADTKSEKFYANALGIIAQKQTELNKISKATGDALGKTVNNTQKATQSLTDLSRIAQDAPYGFIGIANNINPLIESFGRLKASTGTTGGALKALVAGLAGPAGLGLAVGVASSLFVAFGDRLFDTGKAAEKAKTDADKLKDSIAGIYGETAKEAAKVTSFVAILQNENETRKRKLQAIKELQQIQPEIFQGLKLEGDQVVGLTSSYNTYVESLKTVVAAKIKQAQLDQVIEKLLKAQGVTLTDQEQAAVKFGNEIGAAYAKQIAGSVAGAQVAEKQKRQTQAQTNEIKNLNAEVERLTKDLSQLSKGVKLDEISAPKIKKVKQDKPLDLVFQPIVPDLTNTLKNPIIQALKSPDILSESQQIAKLINDSIEKNVKPLSKSIKLQEVAPEDLAFAKQYVDALGTINEAINSIQIQGLASLGEAIGAAFSGGNVGNVFTSFIDIIAMGITAIGKQLITLGLAAKAVKDALATLFSNPIAMVAAGVGLIAVGSAIRGALSNGIEAREKGGPVSGNTPYLVGERGPELFVPSVGGSIIPNNRMTSFSGRTSMASSGGGRSIVRGNDIILAYARTSRSQNRVNA